MATYYVRQSGGNDVNTGLSFALGWETIQHAADTATASGDIVLICADGTHLPAATVDFDAAAYANSNPATFRGAGATGADDGTVATISGASLGATSDILNLNISSLDIKFQNLRITASTRYGIHITTTVSAGKIDFLNCRIDTHSSHGVYNESTSTGKKVTFVKCEIDTNTGAGFAVPGTTGGIHYYNCKIHDNTSFGIQDRTGVQNCFIVGCQIYDNGGDGLNIPGAEGVNVIGSVFFGNTGDGIGLTSGINDMTIFNCIFRSNSAYGVSFGGSGVINKVAYMDYNCFSNNTSGHIDINGGTPPGSNNVLDNPDFTSEVDGSEDFTLQAGSPCLDVGFGYDGP